MKKLILTEVPNTKELIFERREFNVIVFGLARSGTSMMSGICQRLGVNWISTTDTDEEKEKRREDEIARFGELYKMNEDFYEIGGDNYFESIIKFLATDYSGIKFILPLKHRQIDIIKYRPCRIIQMWRDPEEIRQSQQASYHGNRIPCKSKAEMESHIFKGNLIEAATFFHDANIPVLHVKYRDVIENPREKIEKIAKFINSPVNIDEAVSFVQPSKNRFKKENLIPNI